MNTNHWMSLIDDTCSISELSIPGTHNSGAEKTTGVGKCQSTSIKYQLDNGVRFLDIRCIVKNDELKVYHGIINEHLSFEEVMKYCYDFLKTNQKETILFCLKNENGEKKEKFEEILWKHIAEKPDKWHLEETIPRLNAVRGKIILFRRFSKTSGNIMGIDVSHGWKDNNKRFEIKLPGSSVIIQDKYEVKTADEKFEYIKALLDEAKGKASPSNMYLNFASGYVKIIGVPSVSKVSNGVNPMLNAYFTTYPKEKYGILLMDFADKDAIIKLINSNLK